MAKIQEKIDSLLTEIENIGPAKILDYSDKEKRRLEISNKIEGLIGGLFGAERKKEYMKEVNRGCKGFFYTALHERKIENMRNILLSLKEETGVREFFDVDKKPTMAKVIKKAEKVQKEAERRKSVAEFKYWGFAIELIDTVRRELKEFKNKQDNLLKNIDELNKKIDGMRK